MTYLAAPTKVIPPYVASSTDPATKTPLGSKTSPTLLVPGVGQSVRIDATGRVLLDASAAEPSLSLNHFHPGSLPGASTLLRTWKNNRLVASALGALFEITLDTVGTATAGDNYGLRLKGSVSGSTDLLLNAGATKEYRVDLQAGSDLGGYTGSSPTSFMALARGLAVPFRVNSESVLSAVDFAQDAFDGMGSGVRRRIGFLDAAGNWLSFHESSAGYGANATHRVRLQTPITLKTGTLYYFAVLAMDGTPDNGHRGFTARRAGSTGIVFDTGVDPGLFIHFSAPAGVTFADAAPRDGLANLSWYSQPPTQTYGQCGGADLPNFKGIARSAGLLLTGDLQLQVVTTGTPLIAPTGVNVRVEVAASA